MGRRGSDRSRVRQAGALIELGAELRSAAQQSGGRGRRECLNARQVIDYQRNAFQIQSAPRIHTHAQPGAEAIRHTPGGAGQRFHAIHQSAGRSRTR